jgi:hypothetical protein
MLTKVFNIALVVVASKDTAHVQLSDNDDSDGGMEKEWRKGKRRKGSRAKPFYGLFRADFKNWPMRVSAETHSILLPSDKVDIKNGQSLAYRVICIASYQSLRYHWGLCKRTKSWRWVQVDFYWMIELHVLVGGSKYTACHV